MKTVRNRFPFCYVTGFSLSPDLGVLFLFGVEVHAAAAAPGEGGGDPRARTVLPRLMPASRLRETQRTAYLAADRAASLHHDLLSCNGARFNHSLHDGWRGDEIKKFEKKKGKQKTKTKIKPPLESDGQLSQRPGEAVGSLHAPRAASSSGLAPRFPPGSPLRPPARPLRPGAAVFTPAASGRERGGRLGAGPRGGAEGRACGQRRRRGAARGQAGEGESGWGKNPGWEKSDGPRRETS